MYWTLEKIAEAKNRLEMAESVEFPAMQAYELLSLAEQTLKLIEPLPSQTKDRVDQ